MNILDGIFFRRNMWCRQAVGVGLGALSLVGMGACASGDPEPAEEAGQAGVDVLAIQGGAPESGLRAVGMLQRKEICTGTLIAPDWVLTAQHCMQESATSHTFSVDGDPQTYEADIECRNFGGQGVDVGLVHLKQPVKGVTAMSVNRGVEPIPNTQCVAVGYGLYTENGTTTNGNKRSATVRFLGKRSSDGYMLVSRETGINDTGDSGGPLICGGVIVGVVRGHEGASPKHTVGKYSKLVLPWIDEVMAAYGPNGSRAASGCKIRPTAAR